MPDTIRIHARDGVANWRIINTEDANMLGFIDHDQLLEVVRQRVSHLIPSDIIEVLLHVSEIHREGNGFGEPVTTTTTFIVEFFTESSSTQPGMPPISNAEGNWFEEFERVNRLSDSWPNWDGWENQDEYLDEYIDRMQSSIDGRQLSDEFDDGGF